MRRKLLNYFFIILIILIGIANLVIAPPPLDVELRAEKLQENSQKLDIGKFELTNQEDTQIKEKFDLLKLNLKDELLNVIDEKKEIKKFLANNKVNSGEVVEEFTRIELPTDFKEYDTNNDAYIDLEELIDATGARENAKSAFDDSDLDGDGKISKKEFSYWFPDGITIDISDELNNYDQTENDGTVEVDNDDDNKDVDEEAIDGDVDKVIVENDDLDDDGNDDSDDDDNGDTDTDDSDNDDDGGFDDDSDDDDDDDNRDTD